MTDGYELTDDFELAASGDANAMVRVALFTLANHVSILMRLPPDAMTPAIRASTRELAEASRELLRGRE